MKNLITAASLMLASLSTMAADSAALELVGLSRDGKYAAFEQYGIQDGSGYAYAEITFVDIDANKYAASAVRVVDEDPVIEWNSGVGRPRKNASQKAGATLKKLKIVPANQFGARLRKVVSRSPFEDATSLNEVSFSNRGLFWQAGHYLNRVTLKLSTLELPCPNPNGFCGSMSSEGKNALGIKLDLESISHREDNLNYSKTLQLDTKVPQSRSYIHSYFLKDVYVYDGEAVSLDVPVQPALAKIIVVLGMSGQGFEGSDLDYMFVTAPLK